MLYEPQKQQTWLFVQIPAVSHPIPVHSGNRVAVCRCWSAGLGLRGGGRFLGLTVVLLLGLSWSPSAPLANKISSRRKRKRCRQLLRCCQLFWSYKRPDPPAGSPESRWRARYFSGHCFKGAVVEDQAAILVATVRDEVSHGPLGRAGALTGGGGWSQPPGQVSSRGHEQVGTSDPRVSLSFRASGRSAGTGAPGPTCRRQPAPRGSGVLVEGGAGETEIH